MKLKEKLWNWAHLEGSHNKYTSMTLSMTPETFAEEFGIPNAFLREEGDSTAVGRSTRHTEFEALPKGTATDRLDLQNMPSAEYQFFVYRVLPQSLRDSSRRRNRMEPWVHPNFLFSGQLLKISSF